MNHRQHSHIHLTHDILANAHGKTHNGKTSKQRDLLLRSHEKNFLVSSNKLLQQKTHNTYLTHYAYSPPLNMHQIPRKIGRYFFLQIYFNISTVGPTRLFT